MTDTITVHLTPGELLEAYHALKQQTRFTTTEQRANNESAVKKLETAYGEYATPRCKQCARLEPYHEQGCVMYYTCPHSKPEHQCIVSPDQFACPHFTPNEP